MSQDKGNDLRLDDPEATTKDTVTSQQGSTIEDKLKEILSNGIRAYSFDSDRLYFSIDDIIPKIQAIITTETTKARKDERRTPKCTECKKPLHLTLHPQCWDKQYKALEQAALQEERHD